VRFDVPIAHRGRELYLGLWARVNAGFQGHSSGVQKLAFLSAHETTARADLWLEISGAGSAPLGIQVIAGFQNLDTAAKYVPDPIGHPTETPVPVARGVWHRCEIYVRLPATNPGNGVMRVWVDGVLALDRTDVPMTFESLGWVQARLEPIWGGVDDMKTQEDFIWYDHTYVSAP